MYSQKNNKMIPRCVFPLLKKRKIIYCFKRIYILNISILSILCYSSVITYAQALTFHNSIQDGRLIQGSLAKDEKLFYQDKQIIPNSNGLFYFGIPQSAQTPLLLTLQKENTRKQIKLSYEMRHRQTDIVNGLPQGKVSVTVQNKQRIAKENAELKAERRKFIIDFFPICFSRPVQNYRLSGLFGAQRILNGVKGNGHGGTDYAAPVGTPVYAPADGLVAVVHPDMFLTGQTVLINHGYGLFSSYSHLSKTDVARGDKIKRGDKIGEIGQTGRATGPHLHFSFFWYETRVDPELIFTDFPCH